MENLKKEMQKNEVSVLGVSEVRWKGQGEIRSGDYTVYYSGGKRAEKGVAIVVHKSIVRSVIKKFAYNDSIIATKLQAEQISILMMQMTSDKDDTNTIIIRDWNSVIGDESYRNIVGPHGLGRKNHRGKMFINFCEEMA